MSLWGKLFGEKEIKPGRNRQLPSSKVNEIFGEVDVQPIGSENRIMFTILMEGSDENYRTAVAIDASASMQGAFGRNLLLGTRGNLPQSLQEDYKRKGWLRYKKHKGDQLPILADAAKRDLVDRGYYVWTTNEVEPVARDFTKYLATLDDNGVTNVIYWACGDGGEIEVIGELTAEECATASFSGPTVHGFGTGTMLLPALRYFLSHFVKAKRSLFVFITDGEIHDLEEVKAYTITLCKAIERKERNPVKCILIGVGSEIKEPQMEELDDLDSGTEIDIWDHKIAKEMRSLKEIFAELVSENTIIAPTARIFDDSGTLVKNFADGLPAKVTFKMPASSKWFELEVADIRIRQTVDPTL